MDAGAWISLIAAVSSVIMMIVSVIVILRSSARDREKEIQLVKDDLKDRMEKYAKDDRDRRKAIYDEMNKRFKDVDETYVRRDMCKVLHNSLKESTDAIRDDLRRLNEMDGG